jgi:hypothetical protein
VLNLQIEQIDPRHLRKSTDKHARHQLFRFDPYQSLQAACRKGNLKAVINLIENEKVSWEGNSIDFIALAADRNHSAVCAYLASHLNESKKQECLAASLRSQSFPLVVALLENMKDYDLSSSLLKQVLAYQNEIRKTFFQLLLLANTQGNEADVKVRNENVRDHKNALALVLGSELKIVKDHTINKNP